MKLGKTLWKLVFIKLLIIVFFLNLFIHDKTFKSEYKTEEKKIDFVYKSLIDNK